MEIRDDGGVFITGTNRDLRTLAQWLILAAEEGRMSPAFMSDKGLATITIERIPSHLE